MKPSTPFVVSALCFGVHVLMMAPGLTWFDGGELALAAGSMGVPHPPGEPAWAAIAALMSLVPIGSLPFRLAVLSAATVAGAAGLLCVLVDRVALRWLGPQTRHAGLVAGLCFGLGPAAVHQATRVELYGWMALLGIAAALLVERGGRRGVALAVVPLAVAGAVHHAMLVAAIPGLTVLALGRGRGSVRAGVAAAAALVVPALGQWLWLPLRSMHAPPIDFGHPIDLQRTLWSVLARGYARSFHPVEGQLTDNLVAHARMLRLDLGDLGLVFAAVALALALVRGRRGAAAALLLVGIGVLPTVLQGVFRTDNPDARGYLLGPWAVACVGAGLGSAWAILQLRERTRLARLVGLGLVPLLVLPPLVASQATSDRSKLESPLRLGNAVLDEAPPGAWVLPAGDSWSFPALYARYWTGRRPDVVVVPLHMLELVTLDVLRQRGVAVPSLPDAARARVSEAHRALVGEAMLRELLPLLDRPVLVNDVALPPDLLASRRPTGLLYALDTAAERPGATVTQEDVAELEQALWEDTIAPLSKADGFVLDTVGQDALASRFTARAGWMRARGFGPSAREALQRGSSLASDPWDRVHLWRHRFDTGVDGPGVDPAQDAQARAALELLFDGRMDEAGAAVRALLSESPSHPLGLLAAERLYSLGVQASPSVPAPPGDR
jgi:hypothetical protein